AGVGRGPDRPGVRGAGRPDHPPAGGRPPGPGAECPAVAGAAATAARTGHRARRHRRRPVRDRAASTAGPGPVAGGGTHPPFPPGPPGGALGGSVGAGEPAGTAGRPRTARHRRHPSQLSSPVTASAPGNFSSDGTPSPLGRVSQVAPTVTTANHRRTPGAGRPAASTASGANAYQG